MSCPILYFGTVKPVGADIKHLKVELASVLEKANYGTIEIKLSKLLAATPLGKQYISAAQGDLEAGKHALMAAGDAFRTKVDSDAVAKLGVRELERIQAEIDAGSYGSVKGSYDGSQRGIAVMFDSLMHQTELSFLRGLYGERFFLISCFSRPDRRRKAIVESIVAKGSGDEETLKVAERCAEDLLRRERGQDYDFVDPLPPVSGTVRLNVEKTFHEADFFADIDETADRMQGEIRRFVRLIFGDPFGIARLDESGMAIAFAAADQSSTLARRVGAAVVNDGFVVATGRNDLPLRDIGQVRVEDDAVGEEELRTSVDASDKERIAVFEDAIRAMSKVEADEDAPAAAQAIAGLTGDDLKKLIEWLREQDSVSSARVFDLIEFNPTVHAEMSAITGAARRGVPLEGATLYTTTFPCHECTRHIISTGISKVVYLEPYIKSKARDLFPKQLVLDAVGKTWGDDQVAYAPFIGVAPRRHRTLFSWSERKQKDGQARQYTLTHVSPIRESIWPGTSDALGEEVEAAVRKLQQRLSELLEEKMAKALSADPEDPAEGQP